jgi:hypothetical protein
MGSGKSGKGFSEKAKENRKNNRYPVEAEVTILCGSYSAQLKTIDISASGFSIKGSLSKEFHNKELDVTIVYTKSDRTKLTATGKCRLAARSDNRVEVFDPPNGFQSLLDDIWG